MDNMKKNNTIPNIPIIPIISYHTCHLGTTQRLPHLEAIRQAIRGGNLALQHLHHLLRPSSAIQLEFSGTLDEQFP